MRPMFTFISDIEKQMLREEYGEYCIGGIAGGGCRT